MENSQLVSRMPSVELQSEAISCTECPLRFSIQDVSELTQTLYLYYFILFISAFNCRRTPHFGFSEILETKSQQLGWYWQVHNCSQRSLVGHTDPPNNFLQSRNFLEDEGGAADQTHIGHICHLRIGSNLDR